MNKHTKVSLIVAPFLLIAGYGLMDLYLLQTKQERIIQMDVVDADCNITGKKCILTASEMEMSIYLEDNMTVVNTTLPMYRVILLVAGEDGTQTESQLGMTTTPYYWRAEMNLSEQLAASPNGMTMRVVGVYEKDSFISEFNAR